MRKYRHLVAGLVAVLAVVATVGVATGAGSTDVTLSADQTSIETGERTNLTVTVEAAEGGVGSMDLGIVADTGVVNVTASSIEGAPWMEDVRVGDGTIVLAANGMDTADEGRVRVATLTVEGARAGETALDLEVTALGDENGSSYEATAVDGPTLAVVEPASTSGDEYEGRPRDDGDDGTDDEPDGTDESPDDADAGADGADETNETEPESASDTGESEPDETNETNEKAVEEEQSTGGVPTVGLLVGIGVVVALGVVGVAYWRRNG